MLMVLVDSNPTGEQFWAAAKVQGRGRALAREDAEALASQTTHEARFLMRVTKESEQLARDVGAPTLAMMPGETIWDYGEPTRVDMLAALRNSAFSEDADGTEWPDSDKLPVSVAAVIAQATTRFGPADTHEVEAAFDAFVMDLGGKRHGDPPFYDVSLAAMGIQ